MSDQTMSDRLKTDLYTIWDRGRHGISWDDSWVQDFIDDLGEVLPEATIRDKRGKYRSGDFIVIPVSDGGSET